MKPAYILKKNIDDMLFIFQFYIEDSDNDVVVVD